MAFRAGGFILAGSFYLLLIDTLDPPELYAGAAAALIAAIVFEVSREQGFAEARISPAWLLRAWRALFRVPPDIARVCIAALRQVAAPRKRRGTLRAVSFQARSDQPPEVGRRALAEALGSLAPNTIVIGIDTERGLILAHQLHRSGGADDIDPLGLG